MRLRSAGRWFRGLRWLVVAGLVLLSFAAVGAPASARVYVPDCNYKPVFKPKTIQICSVGVLRQARNLHWYRWGGRKAQARGRFVYQTCEPSCVNGRVQRRKARVVLFGKRYCSHSRKRVYTRMRIIARGESRDPYAIRCGP
jgi:hypothetical protein